MDAETRRLQKALLRALNQDELDLDEVVRISNQLASSDPSHVRFFADAGIVRRLGRELVAKQETALAELIKNAYDADAKRVTIKWAWSKTGSSIEVNDDGNGMNRSQLLNGFMRLATDDKIENPISPRFKRPRAGRKGIGRFAAERLGKRLIITTQVESATDALSIAIDWSRYERGHDLSEISHAVEIQQKVQNAGTVLRIEGLYDEWSDAQIRRVFRFVAGLLQPFPIATKRKKNSADPGFHFEFIKSDGKTLEPEVVNLETEVLAHAQAVITARIDARGQTKWSLVSDRFKVRVDNEPIGLEREQPTPLKFARNIALHARYFLLLSEFYPKDQLEHDPRHACPGGWYSPLSKWLPRPSLRRV